MKLVRIDHVQLAIPAGGEPAARKFYCKILGLREIPKPAELAKRGGCWFENETGAIQLHLGIEADFRPAKKAHPALEVIGLAKLVIDLSLAGVTAKHDVPLDGVERVHIEDPFGNRIELLEKRR